MRYVLRLLTTALTLGMLGLGGSAGAADELMVAHTSLTTTTEPGATCTDIPITWDVTLHPDADSWVVLGNVLSSAGDPVASISIVEDYWVTQSSDTIGICGLAGPGVFTYRLDVTVRSIDVDEPYLGDQELILDELFTVTVPAPEHQSWTTDLGLTKKRWVKYAAAAKFVGSVKVGYACALSVCLGTKPARVVKIQGLRDGRWTTLRELKVVSSAYLRIQVAYKFTKLRAKVAQVTVDPGDGTPIVTYGADRTSNIRVPARPAA